MADIAATPALRHLQDLPGPKGLPLVGNVFQLDRDTIHQRMEAWSREYGPIFMVHFGRMPVLAIADHELTRQVLRARPETFQRASQTNVVANELGFAPGVFRAEGADWQRQRRMVMAGFTPQRVRAYFPAMHKVVGRLQGRWRKAAEQQQSIDMQADLMRYTVDTICGLAFGSDVNTLQADGDDVIQKHLDQIFPAIYRRITSLVPYWRVLKLPADRALERSLAEVAKAIAGFIAEARQRLSAEPSRREAPPNLLESFIVAAEEEGSGIRDQDVAGNVMTMLLAGEDTTANSMAWMIYLLSRNPDAMAQAVAEVRRVLPKGLADVTPESMAELDYIEACANETMRLKPVAPFIPLEAAQDTVIAGIAVPKGTTVWNVMRHDSLSKDYFPDPHAFRPERWLGEHANHSAAKNVSMPFGSGPRVCPGRYLALLEMKMAMAMLLHGFELDEVYSSEGGEPRERMAFTMEPVGLMMRLKTRAPASAM